MYNYITCNENFVIIIKSKKIEEKFVCLLHIVYFNILHKIKHNVFITN